VLQLPTFLWLVSGDFHQLSVGLESGRSASRFLTEDSCLSGLPVPRFRYK